MFAEAVALQCKLAAQVREEALACPICTIAGADVAFTPDGKGVVAAVVVLRYDDFSVIERASAVVPLEFPYVPGLLSFREAPAILAAARRLSAVPDVLIVDGQGKAHPRRCGLACHVGVKLDWPTIGCAKSRLVGVHRDPGSTRGCACQLKHGGEVVGSVVRSRQGVKCLYVSVGHRITLKEAVKVVLRCCPKYRVSEPIRQAHAMVSELRVHCDLDKAATGI